MKYRKKPVVIDAMLYNGNNAEEVAIKLGMPEVTQDFLTSDLIIETLEGDMRANPGDYVIKGIKGEFYPCKSDVFNLSYEPANDED